MDIYSNVTKIILETRNQHLMSNLLLTRGMKLNFTVPNCRYDRDKFSLRDASRGNSSWFTGIHFGRIRRNLNCRCSTLVYEISVANV